MSSAFPDAQVADTVDYAPELIRQVQNLFRQQTETEPEYTILAPGRVNLIGEHVDYNGGFVLPMAIQRHVAIAARRSQAPTVSLLSSSQDGEVRFDLDQPLKPSQPAWANYAKGVLAGFRELGTPLPGFQAVIAANLPMGGGLSSSAALEVAVCRLLETLTGHRLTDLDCIRLCQKAEHTFAGVPCGIMDQFIVTKALRHHALLLDCQSLESRHVPLNSTQTRILITHSGVAHELGKGQYAKRRADCERAAHHLGVTNLRDATPAQLETGRTGLDPLAFRRARHVLSETQRTLDFARCLQDQDWQGAGRLMYASHKSLKDDYEVSCDELDTLVSIAQDLGLGRGVYGSRLTGAGFGGCTVTLVQARQAEAVRDAINAAYEDRTDIRAESFLSLPAAGGRRL